MTTIILSIIIVILIVATIWLYHSLQKNTSEAKQVLAENASTKAILDNTTSQLNEAKSNLEKLSPLVAENATLREQNRITSEQLDEARATIESLTPLNAENATLREQIRIINEEKTKLQQESEARFKLLANEIFDDKTKRFKELNENRLTEILNPLKEQILKFEGALQLNVKNDIKDREALREHLRMLMELNQTISKEAQELTQALKGNSKVQGDWGETILKTILESCGLQEGVAFTLQQTKDDKGNTLKDSEGRNVRPDAVVKFPGNKSIIIDSKVSLKNYVDFCSATNDVERKEHLKKHLSSIKDHIDALKGFKYQNVIENSADFIMMFVPNEGAYITAMQADNNLWKYAYDNHVVIISPTHLISVLKLVDQLWQHDKQTKNAVLIAEETGKLYDKFANFIKDMQDIDNSIKASRNAYDKAMNKLTTGTGNIVKRIQDIKALGAKTSKTLAIEAKEE